MAYSEKRTQQTLAVMRIVMGLMFLASGWYKVFTPQIYWQNFLDQVQSWVRGPAVDFYQPFLLNVVIDHPRVFASLIGMTELFLGVGLLLGLAVRPVALIGMLYMLNLMCATIFAPGPHAPMGAYVGAQVEHLATFFLLATFAIAHAGETWGLGALYHHSRGLSVEHTDANPLKPNETPVTHSRS